MTTLLFLAEIRNYCHEKNIRIFPMILLPIYNNSFRIRFNLAPPEQNPSIKTKHEDSLIVVLLGEKHFLS
jgi:hypothetical protein